MGVEDEDYSGHISKPNRRGTQDRDHRSEPSHDFKSGEPLPGGLFEPRKRQNFKRGGLIRKK